MQFRLLIAALALLGCAVFSAPAAAGDGPTYLILRGPLPVKDAPSLQVLRPQPYAYGWFGTRPSYRFQSKSHGYYRGYTQWSYR